METQRVKIDSNLIADDFSKAMEGKLSPAQIEDAASAINSTTNGYPANGSMASLIFYVKAGVYLTAPGSKSFTGDGGGIFTPGGGAFFGTVYTDDLNALYANTVSFQVTATAVYVSVIFFDGSSRVLGTFQAGAVSTITGGGGGSGRWT